MQIGLLKFLDCSLGRVLTCLWQSSWNPNHSPTNPRHVLFIRPGGIGDAVLLLPAIQAFRQRFPSCQIDILAERRNVGVFTLIPKLGAVYCYDRPGDWLKLWRHGYDVVIDTEQWHRLSAAVARSVRAQARIGFASNDRRKLFSHVVDYSQDDYEAISFLRLLEPLGIPTPKEVRTPFLAVSESLAHDVARLFPESLTGPFVAIFPGASIPEKRWGNKRFRELSKCLVNEGFFVVVLGGAKERACGEEILSGIKGLNLAGMTSLAETAAIIYNSSVLVSGDSGVLHIASGFEISTVSIFGPSNKEKWAPRGERHRVLRKPMDCSPCSQFGNTPVCPNGVCCLSELTVSEVFAATMSLITQTQRAR